MGLPQWCQTHSLEEFLYLLEGKDKPSISNDADSEKERNMTNVETTITNAQIAEAAVTCDALLANSDGGSGGTTANVEDLIKDDFVQEDPADGIFLN